MKYYRAMGRQEADGIINQDMIINQQRVSYWAESRADAEMYRTAGRVIMCIECDRAIPTGYRGVAMYDDGKNHVEYVVPKHEMELFLSNVLDIEVM